MTRRDEVLQAALEVLVDNGTYGLTHRKVDARAGLPAGTTANGFPSRMSLVRAVLRAVTEHEQVYVSQLVESDCAADPEKLLFTWLRQRVAYMLGPGRLHALTWYRLTIDGASVPEVRAELAAARARLFEDCKAIVVKCGSSDPDRHAASLRSYIGGIVPAQHIAPIPDFDLDEVLRPFARGLVHVIERDAGGPDG